MAAKRAPLRAVGPDEKVKRSGPMKVTEAAESGDRRELLAAMRSRVAKAVEDPETPARDLAALSRRLLEIAKDIEAIDAGEQEDDIGEAARTPDEEWTST